MGIRVLVIGSGGREHALSWRLALEGADKVIAAPGNALMADVADVRADVALNDRDALVAHAERVQAPDSVIEAVGSLPDLQFANISEVAQALGLGVETRRR